MLVFKLTCYHTVSSLSVYMELMGFLAPVYEGYGQTKEFVSCCNFVQILSLIGHQQKEGLALKLFA